MFYRYTCPVCTGDLRSHLPVVQKSPWYKLKFRNTLLCPHCGAKIEKRFATFDALFAAGFFAALATGGFLSVWHLVRVLIPMIGFVLVLRFVAGLFFSVYVQAKKK